MAEDKEISKLQECWKDISDKASILYQYIEQICSQFSSIPAVRYSDGVQYSFQKINEYILSDTAHYDIDYYCNLTHLSNLFIRLEEALERTHHDMEIHRSFLLDLRQALHDCRFEMYDLPLGTEKMQNQSLKLFRLETQICELEDEYNNVWRGAEVHYQEIQGHGMAVLKKDDGFGFFGVDPRYVDRELQEFHRVWSPMIKMMDALLRESRSILEQIRGAISTDEWNV